MKKIKIPYIYDSGSEIVDHVRLSRETWQTLVDQIESNNKEIDSMTKVYVSIKEYDDDLHLIHMKKPGQINDKYIHYAYITKPQPIEKVKKAPYVFRLKNSNKIHTTTVLNKTLFKDDSEFLEYKDSELFHYDNIDWYKRLDELEKESEE